MQATFFKSHLSGVPMRAMQHPLHYPHGTLFMAPGPAGQTVGVPNDPGLRQLMRREGYNQRRVHSQYNFDISPEPKSFAGRAHRWHAREAKLVAKERALQKKIAESNQRRCAPDRHRCYLQHICYADSARLAACADNGQLRYT